MEDSLSFYDIDIRKIFGVGERRAKMFAHLDVHNLYDLLHYYPRSYVDFSSCINIVDAVSDELFCIRAEVCSQVKSNFIRKGMTLYKFDAMDDTAVIHMTIFNNNYLAESLQEGETYFFIGKITNEYGRYSMNPQIVEKARDDLFSTPVYNLTAGLTSKIVANAVKSAIQIYREHNVQDPIPDRVRKAFNLCHEQFAISAIHFPSNANDIEIARNRFIFEELFFLQCGMLKLKSKAAEATGCSMAKDFCPEYMKMLPFELTGAQKKVIGECVKDMMGSKPMNRLVQGDVGSGKTAVAATLIYSMVKNGFQCAFMAPTELLAKQHVETLSKLMPDEIHVELLTGSQTAATKKKIKARIQSGEVNVIVGTHALLTDDVEFENLGLVVTDEQHRFGVNQRGLLSAKGDNPHVLVMSATPIPRTLSLIIYGELDVSIIDELPKGRQKISTYFVNSTYEKRIYNFIKKHLDRDLQAYIVCPLVDENGDPDLTAATEYADSLSQNEFANYNVGLVHGKMKAKEKATVMQKFAEGEVQLLVSTTVIEVGIDVPSSVIMFIRNAERFGLSQLHQLRGRVGRGTEKSYCILMSDTTSETTRKRFEIMVKSSNGFEIADEDLKLRGPGDFFGERQSGLPKLNIADFVQDIDVVKNAAKAARYVFRNDPKLEKPENAALRYAIERLFESENKIIFN